MKIAEAIIPAEKIPAVKTALKAAFDTEEADGITALSGGLSAALVFKITVKGEHYLLRIIMHVNEMNDPARQYECLKLAAAAGLAPAVYYTSVADGVSITDFIEAKPIKEGFKDQLCLLTELAAKVKAIHELPLFPVFMNFLDGIDLFIAEFRSSGILPEPVTAELFDLYGQIQQSYPRHNDDLVSSHNDLNPNNILFDGGKLWIIDWEAAFKNDRYVDLAIIAQSFARKPEQQELLLTQYFGSRPTDHQRARFFLMQQVCLMFYGLMMFRLASGSKASGDSHDSDMDVPPLDFVLADIGRGKLSLSDYEGQITYAKALFNELLFNMRSPQFVSCLQIINN